MMDEKENDVKMEEKVKRKKPDPVKMQILRGLPLEVKEKLTKEEVEAFLYADTWPESLYEKLKDYMVDEQNTSK